MIGLLTALWLALAPTPAPPAAPAPQVTVRVVKIGDVPDALVEATVAHLPTALPVRVERGADLPLPARAWYAPRKRYRADVLLEILREGAADAPPDVKVLALTSVDISTTKGAVHDWGVFGLGDLGGRACVVSQHRLKRRARDAAHLRERVVRTAVHEVGHTLGLPHCEDPDCVMRDAEGTIRSVDQGDGTLGPRCRAQLAR